MGRYIFLPFFDIDPGKVQMLGTGQWDVLGLGAEPALLGGWYAAPDPLAREVFLRQYKKIYDSESIGLKKPNLLVFNHAITDSNSLKSESLMIGDSLEADIEGALNAGLNAIHFIAHGERIHNKCKIIHDLDELIGIL